jgi:hypothetical protein
MVNPAADRLAYLKSLRLKIRAALEGSVENAATSSYTIGDEDGTQTVHRRSPKELWDMLTAAEAEIAELERALSGGGIRTFGTRVRP